MASLLVRGKVHTFDKNRSVATNLLVRDGTVCEIESSVDEVDEIIELGN